MGSVDLLDENGLETKDLATLIAALETSFKSIYGSDIIVTSSSPDGQIINLHCQAGVDIRELITDVYNSFDPDQCGGTVLDARCKINNVRRIGGTFTIVSVTVTVSETVTLEGLDADYNEIDGEGYTVQDDAGNEFILIDTIEIAAGAHALDFRAKEIGAVLVTAGTITTQKTIVLGVTSVNNAGGASTTGQDQETDVELKIRRSQSKANNSSGYLNGIEGTIRNLDGVSDAVVYENYEDATDANGIPPHCIWAIVEGGSSTDIANVLRRKAPGCDMKGAVDVTLSTPAGGNWIAYFDRPSAKDLYIRFDFKQTEVGVTPDFDDVKDYIVENLTFTIGGYADAGTIAVVAMAAIAACGGGGVALDVEISDDGVAWADYLETDTLDEKWTPDTTKITITEI